MTDTPKPNGETAKPGDSSNNGTNNGTPQAQPAPQGNAVDPAEVERLRKEKEQAEMRARQLENEKKARDEKEEAKRQKQLEEQNEWKAVAEQEKAKREALEKEREEAVRKIELEESQKKVLAEFPQEVTEAAADIDLKLSDTSDESVEDYKAKLNKLSERVASKGKVGPNNQGNSNNTPSRTERMQEYAKTNSPQVFDEMVGELNWVKQAKAINGED